jgi:hypothetical protein
MENTNFDFTLRNIRLTFFSFLIFFVTTKIIAQNNSKMNVSADLTAKTLTVSQEITFHNLSTETIHSIILNDWNNSYSSNKSLLAKRFSDEFVRSFLLSKEFERGKTDIISVNDEKNTAIKYSRPENNIDLIEIFLQNPLIPNQKTNFTIKYILKIPSDKFTGYGYDDKNGMNLKDLFLTIARFENGKFVENSNADIDDVSNEISDYEIEISVPEKTNVISDLNSENDVPNSSKFLFKGQNRNNFSMYLQQQSSFVTYKNDQFEIISDLKEKKIDEVQKSLIINKVVGFVNENIGTYNNQKIVISQDDYERNPFYGLNQLPSFLNPFQKDFIFELKFLKTYLNNYLKNTLQINPRKDNWIYDGIQVFAMMKYMDEYYPEAKMMGKVAKLKILKRFSLIDLDFNEQYSYFYMLMARINIDQTIGDSKETFLKFNERIAGKYRSGLSLKYLDSYLLENKVNESIKEFILLNSNKQTSETDFVSILKSKTTKNINWFKETVIDSRKIIDFKITDYSKTNDEVTFTIRNKTKTIVPISIYGLKNNQIVFKKWLENIKTDSTFTFERKNADKLVLNYENEVPEFNRRNNFKKIEGFFPNNRPLRFTFLKDLENPNYNQLLFAPTINFNLYDGIRLGMRFFNSTILAKPFVFDIEPSIATKNKAFTGNASFTLNQFIREGNLYNIRYGLYGSSSQYAPDAKFYKFNPVVSFTWRDKDYRANARQSLSFREIIINREKTNFLTIDTEDYAVFDARFGSGYSELTKQFSYGTNVQISDKFGKFSGTINYRKTFNDNRQLNLRFFGGLFLYRNTNSEFFSFALDRPTDYLFDYDYIGRNETSGIFSQQFILAEAGFKTKLSTPFANDWITSVNGSMSIWNWVEAYGDVGFYKNKYQSEKVVFDSGIRLNLVTDYFELYFPVYSSNGFDVTKPNYNEKIRFVLSIGTNTLIRLFTRKWF